MKKKTKIICRIVIVAFIIVIGGLFSIPYINSSAKVNNEPQYKLQENVKNKFRPDWVWDEEKHEYSNLGDLVRDPETGLFPEPSSFPEGLEGYATWDPYLGLYIRNGTRINHETGEVTFDNTNMISSKEGWPEYDQYADNAFNNMYWKYTNYTREKFYKPNSSNAYPDMDLFEWAGLTSEWFELSTNDLPMLMDKLEAGSPPSYTMSLIMLLSKTDVGIRPSLGSLDTTLVDWVTAFNALTSGAREQVKQCKLEGLGYLALPFIYDELVSGNDSLLAALPDQTDGLNGADKAETASWSKEDWLAWFKDNAESMETFRYVCQRTINMPWLENFTGPYKH